MRERRAKTQIYLYFLHALMNNKVTSKHETYPLTTIQRYCGLSYDKTQQRRDELVKYGLITDNPLQITLRGIQYYKQISRAQHNIDLIMNGYCTESKEIPAINDMIIPCIDDKVKEMDPIKKKLIDFQQIYNANAAIIEELEQRN